MDSAHFIPPPPLARGRPAPTGRAPAKGKAPRTLPAHLWCSPPRTRRGPAPTVQSPAEGRARGLPGGAARAPWKTPKSLLTCAHRPKHAEARPRRPTHRQRPPPGGGGVCVKRVAYLHTPPAATRPARTDCSHPTADRPTDRPRDLRDGKSQRGSPPTRNPTRQTTRRTPTKGQETPDRHPTERAALRAAGRKACVGGTLRAAPRSSQGTF